jgi:hypothetical protein
MTSENEFSAERKATSAQRLTNLFALILATGAPAASNFLLTPILIRALGNSAFGQWALLEPIIMLGAAIFTLGSQYGALSFVSRNAIQTGPAISCILLVIGTVVLIAGPIVIVAAGMTFGFAIAITVFLNQLFDAIAGAFSSVFRANRKNWGFALVEGGRTGLLRSASPPQPLFCAPSWLSGCIRLPNQRSRFHCHFCATAGRFSQANCF